MKGDEGYGRTAIAALALVIALGWLEASVYAAVSALSAYLETHFAQEKPPLIRCAAIASEGSPCFPDPGLTRLGIPQPLPYTPQVAPIAPLQAPPAPPAR